MALQRWNEYTNYDKKWQEQGGFSSQNWTANQNTEYYQQRWNDFNAAAVRAADEAQKFEMRVIEKGRSKVDQEILDIGDIYASTFENGGNRGARYAIFKAIGLRKMYVNYQSEVRCSEELGAMAKRIERCQERLNIYKYNGKLQQFEELWEKKKRDHERKTVANEQVTNEQQDFSKFLRSSRKEGEPRHHGEISVETIVSEDDRMNVELDNFGNMITNQQSAKIKNNKEMFAQLPGEFESQAGFE